MITLNPSKYDSIIINKQPSKRRLVVLNFGNWFSTATCFIWTEKNGRELRRREKKVEQRNETKTTSLPLPFMYLPNQKWLLIHYSSSLRQNSLKNHFGTTKNPWKQPYKTAKQKGAIDTSARKMYLMNTSNIWCINSLNWGRDHRLVNRKVINNPNTDR